MLGRSILLSVVVLTAASLLLAAAPADAQTVETTGEPGSPGATTTIDGQYLDRTPIAQPPLM